MKQNLSMMIMFLLLISSGCRRDEPTKSDIDKLIIQYLNSLNLPLEVNEIQMNINGYNEEKLYFLVDIKVKADILSEDGKTIIYKIENTYDSKFFQIVYGYWKANFNLVRKAPDSSTVFSLSSKYLLVNQEQIKISAIDSYDDKESYYPVKIAINKNDITYSYTFPFFQDEFGIWKIGISNLVTPEGAVKEFLSEVNNGNTDKARRYFSYEYKLGYDESDQKNLEQLFPPGSIKDISISDVVSIKNTADLKLTVVKTDADTFKTSLQMIKCGIEWRFNYNGWDWKFKSTNL